MNAAQRTVLTLQPLLDENSPQATNTLTQGLEDYDIVRSKVIGAHHNAERYVSDLGKTCLNLIFAENKECRTYAVYTLTPDIAHLELEAISRTTSQEEELRSPITRLGMSTVSC